MRAADVAVFLTRVAGRRSSADIWYAQLGNHGDEVGSIARDCLSLDEQARVGQYRSREVAERYVMSRAMVRMVLSERLKAAPADLRLGRTDAGKPTIQGLHFNLSHSGDLIVLAVNERQDVGVDIERRRDVKRVDALVRRWLTVAEREDLEREMARGVERSESFLRVWSQKEARLKAIGVGIAGAQTARVQEIECVTLEPYFSQLPASRDANGYVGAIAFA
jgi:4'-phosphopantetheinyl transferase